MNDAMDGYIQQALKNWAAEQKPPVNGRARLLLLASSPTAQGAYFEKQQSARLDNTRPVNKTIFPAPGFCDLPYLFAVQLTYTTLRRVT
jgi:hypothetical protein